MHLENDVFWHLHYLGAQPTLINPPRHKTLSRIRGRAADGSGGGVKVAVRHKGFSCFKYFNRKSAHLSQMGAHFFH